MSIFSRLSVLVIIAISLFGCAESDKSVLDQPPLIEKLEFPYINNHALYEFIPDTGESQAVEALFAPESQTKLASFLGEIDDTTMYVHSPEGNIVYLDIDQSVEAKDENALSYLQHTLLAELVAYSVGPIIYLYDLNTRHAFPITKFDNEDGSATQICEIRPSITLDEESRLVGEILYKNEAKLYVRTASHDCSTGSFSYHQIDLETDNDTEYEIRRYILEEHTHTATHTHAHENDHAHDHAFEEGELDSNGLPFDPNRHSHQHTHDHDLNYGDLEEHLYISKEELDEIHSSPTYLKTTFEYNEIWVGRATTTSEALMNTGHPIFNAHSDEFGYFGYNTEENQFEFYVNHENSTFKNLEYTFDLDELDIPALIQPLIGEDTETPWFNYVDDSISFKYGNYLVNLPIRAIFDDDQSEIRENRFEFPLYELKNPNDFEIIYQDDSGNLYIRDGIELYNIANETRGTDTQLLGSYPAEEASAIDTYATSSTILIRKFYSEENTKSNHDLSSTVRLDIQASVEDTLLPTSERYIKILDMGNGNIHMQGELVETGKLHAQAYNSTLTNTTHEDFVNSMWSKIDNMLDDDRQALEIAIINSEDSTLLPLDDRELPALKNANIYTYDSSHLLGHGKLLGTIPGNLTEVLNINIRSDLFGEIKVKDSFEIDAPTKTYFFPTGRSFINPTGSFDDMKLMYDDSPPAANEDINELDTDIKLVTDNESNDESTGASEEADSNNND